ncbi:MAG: hypothetical protein KDK07_18525 [Bauldia sp.]|nr:hypothetical protein [Bauldia sp.]
MVKFVAKQPVNPAALEAFEFLLDPFSATLGDKDGSHFTAESGDVRIEVTGSGFKYALNELLPTGTVTRVKVFLSDQIAYDLKNAAIDVGDLVTASSVESAFKKVFKGKDKFVGSSGDDEFATGGKSDKLDGKSGDDKLHGDGGKDKLDGGDGSDELDGGGGKDTYVFKDAPGSGIDTITNFQSGEKLKISMSVFDGLSKGKLVDGAFVDGTEAQDSDDRFIYDSSTGKLYHDADGVGGQAQVQFALLQPGLSNFGAENIIIV